MSFYPWIVLRILLLTMVFAPVALAKDHSIHSGRSTRHFQYLCTSQGLQLFKIGENGTLTHTATDYNIDNATLAQTPNAIGLASDPNHHFLCVFGVLTYNQGSADMAVINRMIVSQHGKLNLVSHQEFPMIGSGGEPLSIAFGERGKFSLIVFSSGQNGNKTYLLVCHVQENGTLHPVSKPIVLRNNFQSMVTDPYGHYVYVTYMQDSHIYQYSVLPNAALNPLDVPSVHTAKQPVSIAVHPLQHFAYVTSQGGDSVTVYHEDREGKLTLLANYYFGKNKVAPTIVITPNGHFLYVCFPMGNTFQYRILANGTLKALTPKVIHAGGYKMIVDLTSKFAYSLSNITGTNIIYQYRIQADGNLMPLIPRFISGIGNPASIAIIQN